MEHTEFQQELIKIDGRLKQMITEVREGFNRMDQRFEAMQTSMDQRFGAMLQQMARRFNRQTAMMSIGFLVITTLITIYRFLGQLHFPGNKLPVKLRMSLRDNSISVCADKDFKIRAK